MQFQVRVGEITRRFALLGSLGVAGDRVDVPLAGS
jgi:hypothetical protein